MALPSNFTCPYSTKSPIQNGEPMGGKGTDQNWDILLPDGEEKKENSSVLTNCDEFAIIQYEKLCHKRNILQFLMETSFYPFSHHLSFFLHESIQPQR